MFPDTPALICVMFFFLTDEVTMSQDCSLKDIKALAKDACKVKLTATVPKLIVSLRLSVYCMFEVLKSS